jgi:hypothetical protein
MISKTHEHRLNLSSPEGMVKEAAVEKYRKEHNIGEMDKGDFHEKAVPLGFGTARGDLDWVDDSKKH